MILLDTIGWVTSNKYQALSNYLSNRLNGIAVEFCNTEKYNGHILKLVYFLKTIYVIYLFKLLDSYKVIILYFSINNTNHVNVSKKYRCPQNGHIKIFIL